jgi:hypothetical protein
MDIHFGKLAHEIERAERIIRLQAEIRLQTQLGLRTDHAPAIRRVFFRLPVGILRNLFAIGEADHVALKDDAAHPHKLHTERLEEITPANFRSLRAAGDLRANFRFACLEETAVFPMTVRGEHDGQFSCAAFRPIQTASKEMSRIALEMNLLDGVFFAINLPMYDRMKRGLFRHGPQARCDEDLSPDLLGPHFPGFARFRRYEREISVLILELIEPCILR